MQPRDEPMVTVFASSRDIKRAVGPTAWVILEDIALDAVVDERGRLVADTSVRRIAANLGIDTDTVARDLVSLRAHRLVQPAQVGDRHVGWKAMSHFVIDASAGVEPFMSIPSLLRSEQTAWLVQALSDAWQLHDQTQRLRAERARATQRGAAEACVAQARERQRDARLAGWTAAVSEALTDSQLVAAVALVTEPVGGLDRRSAPLGSPSCWPGQSMPQPPRQTTHSTQHSSEPYGHRPAHRSSSPEEVPAPQKRPGRPIATRSEHASKTRSILSTIQPSPAEQHLKE